MALFSCQSGRRVEGVHDYVRGDWAPGRARSCYRLVFVINYMTSLFHHVPLLIYVYCSVYGSRYTEYYSRYPEPQAKTIPGELYHYYYDCLRVELLSGISAAGHFFSRIGLRGNFQSNSITQGSVRRRQIFVWD